MFYLKHGDEKGDQILVDNEFNITGIIDWEWAQTDSKSAAFNSPIVLLPVTGFYEGADYIGKDEVYWLLKMLGIEGDSNWETWKADALQRYREDHQLKQLLRLSEDT
jgi:hypothetical protein